MYFVPLDNYVTYGLNGHCHLREGELAFILKNYFASIFYSTNCTQDFYLKVVLLGAAISTIKKCIFVTILPLT